MGRGVLWKRGRAVGGISEKTRRRLRKYMRAEREREREIEGEAEREREIEGETERERCCG